MRNRYLYITLMSLLGFSSEAAAQAIAQTPQLVISIAIDQLRTDYLETYLPLYSQGGFRQLLAKGMVYPNASYNFSPVDQASASASLLTGSTPYYNGVTGMEWLDRKTLRPQNIVEDKDKGLSPAQLQTSTLGDEIKIAFDGRSKVFSFATRSESAILSAGHVADGVVWCSQGAWSTTPYYPSAEQWLSQYTRLYTPTSDANRNVTSLALKCIEQSGIGLDDNTDLLCIGYTLQPDIVGYQLLDHNIADLIRCIQNRFPDGRVLFVLTGTGTTSEEREEENERFRIPTGKFYINRAANLLNMYLGAVYGSAKYVEACHKNQLYLNRKFIEKKNLNLGDVLRQAQEFVLQMAGVRNVYTSTQLLTSDSQKLERVRNGFNIDKCGDLLIDIAPGWQLVNEETQATSMSRASYIPFPIIFYGTNIDAQRIVTPVTVDRVAPTVARAIRIRAPNACSAEPLF
jgi:hypothetical protein